MNPKTLLLCAALITAAFPCHAEPSPAEAVKHVLIQHNGRVKSFDAFSRQIMELVTGKERRDGKPAISAVLEILSKGELAKELVWIRVDYEELIKALSLPEGRHDFSYNEIVPSSEKIEAFVKSAKQKRDQDLRPTKLEQKAETLYGALVEASMLISGESLKVVPPVEDPEGVWETADRTTFTRDPEEWIRSVDERTGHKFRKKINMEVHYLELSPFRWAWVTYLVAFLVLSFLKKTPTLRLFGAALLATALFFHTYGLALRSLVLARPPVSNMYESVVFMNWVLMMAAVIFAAARKNLAPAVVGALASAVIMIYGDILPLDTSLEVLVPVLRSNYWLTIHVLTIVSSYGVLGLAMGLGHRYLVLDLRKKKISQTENERSTDLILRVIQVGVLLLGIGTTLGGVWANESWGRFWGWDPKETWALITFLGYVIALHLRYAKKLSDFWLAMSTVLGFLLVLMTWYGVNFVLGRGLHSYGQGSGGMGWVILYLALEAAFVGYVLLKKYSSLKT